MRRFATLTTILLAGSFAFAQTSGIKPKSKGEEAAVRAMLAAQDPDARIKAADELLTKYADTGYKPYALYLEADAYYQKADTDKAIVYAEQAAEADPKSYQSYVLLTKVYGNTTHVNDLDKAEKLAKIDKYGKLAIDNLATATKPNPQLPDADWTKIKDDLAGQAYLGIGIGAVLSNKIPDANADFEKVATMDTDPTDLIRAGRALLDAKKYADAVTWFDRALTFPGVPDQIKTIAENDKARAQSMIKKYSARRSECRRISMNSSSLLATGSPTVPCLFAP
jgi:tetratricopeptide (TPR) repeat protein